MTDLGTTREGPLGSTVHVLHADPDTIAALATVDWSQCFSRVCLDPVRELVTLMAPSPLHDHLTGILDHIVDAAGSVLTGAAQGLRHTRLRGRGEPPGTGMEPDCAFYLGERARGYLAALAEGAAVADEFLERNAPDLVVEVEITGADEGKIARYAEFGVRELWWLRGRKGTHDLEADFLALRPEEPPRELAASEVLEGLTRNDVCEAADGVRLSATAMERIEVVTEIVNRRRQASVRVREEEAPYAAMADTH